MPRSIATETQQRIYDRDDPILFIPFVEIQETALARTPNLAVFREALGDDAAEMARLMPQLRRTFPDVPPPAELPSGAVAAAPLPRVCGNR